MSFKNTIKTFKNTISSIIIVLMRRDFTSYQCGAAFTCTCFTSFEWNCISVATSSNHLSRLLYFHCHDYYDDYKVAHTRQFSFQINPGGGPRVVFSTAAFHARVRGSVPGLGGLKETKNVSSPSTCESQYCGEPAWPRGSVLGLRPPGLEFRVLCLKDSVISIISPSSGGSPGPV